MTSLHVRSAPGGGDPGHLVTLVQLTHVLLNTHNTGGPLLVHCSAGVGRTGTFIAVYKLLNDYHDETKERIDPYSTVLEMRGCRMKVVQKKEQYVYIFKCLRDEVKTEEGDYYKDL